MNRKCKKFLLYIYYIFRNTDIERIDSFSSVENQASRKVMEKIGMHYEGLLQHYYKTRDGFHDCTLYGIIRKEWEQTAALRLNWPQAPELV